MSVAYAVGVEKDVANIASSCDGNQSDLRNQNSSKNFRCYFGHHIARSLFGIINLYSFIAYIISIAYSPSYGFGYEYDCNIKCHRISNTILGHISIYNKLLWLL